jgi:phosphoglycerol transferase MdoB-like AlkP superfamily enzyme
LNRRFAANPRGLGKLNVIVVAEESFGAEFSRLYGSERDLTPHFDRHAREGIWFRHMYASGTRTVRGLEAIAASFPPIPSVSILRRPRNEGIATWGTVMRRHGYDASFLYGGYGYFDNMNYFFANNGFTVLDRNDVEHVRFENIWGVSDEDLFDRALAYYDQRHAADKPFFSLVMTTSNHKPFTFRDGVPGVPAHGGGRDAGVRYADFALGYFLDEARKHAWFNNTLFVVVADHGARVYGKAEIPLRQYEIPMMFFAPAHLKPRTIETMTTQVDIAPTVLGLLGLEYEAPFFGTNVLACGACERIALFSHNHDVAGFRDGKLAVLGLGKKEQVLTYDRAHDSYRPTHPDPELLDLTIAIYQTAYEQFQAHTYE